jgi:hypothetical protein
MCSRTTRSRICGSGCRKMVQTGWIDLSMVWCLCVCLSVSICVCICLSACLPVLSFVFPSVYLSAFPFVYFSARLSVYRSPFGSISIVSYSTFIQPIGLSLSGTSFPVCTCSMSIVISSILALSFRSHWTTYDRHPGHRAHGWYHHNTCASVLLRARNGG